MTDEKPCGVFEALLRRVASFEPEHNPLCVEDDKLYLKFDAIRVCSDDPSVITATYRWEGEVVYTQEFDVGSSEFELAGFIGKLRIRTL